MQIPERILEEVEQIAPMLGDKDDWMTVKKLLLLSLPPKLRTNFSTRDPKTKKQSLNDFELALIDEYEKRTGVRLELKQ